MTPFIIIISIRICKNMDFEKFNTQKEYSYLHRPNSSFIFTTCQNNIIVFSFCQIVES